MKEILIAMITVVFAVSGAMMFAALFVDSPLVGFAFAALWVVGVCAVGTIALMI